VLLNKSVPDIDSVPENVPVPENLLVTENGRVRRNVDDFVIFAVEVIISV
jgi:hypothetical protein